jgi:hypothetical protein
VIATSIKLLTSTLLASIATPRLLTVKPVLMQHIGAGMDIPTAR